MIDFPNGTGNRLSVATPGGLDDIEGSDTCSWMCWARYDSRGGNFNSIMGRQVIIDSVPYWESFGFWVRSDGKIGAGICVSGYNQTFAAEGGSTSAGTLYFLAAVYDNNANPRLTLYIDGASAATSNAQSGTIRATDKPFAVAANCNNSNGTTFDEDLDGQVGPFFVSKYALTLDQLEAVRIGRGAVLPPGLVFGAHLMDAAEGAVPSALKSLSGESITVVGSPTGYASIHRLPQPRMF